VHRSTLPDVGDNACIHVFKQFGLTNTIVAVKSSQFPWYSISFRRFLGMIFAQRDPGGFPLASSVTRPLGYVSVHLPTAVSSVEKKADILPTLLIAPDYLDIPSFFMVSFFIISSCFIFISVVQAAVI
jgi:hypothetical protein